MLKIGVVFTCVVEDLKGKIDILLGGDDRDEAFRVKLFGPGFYRWSHGVRF